MTKEEHLTYKPVVIRMHPELAARARAWANSTIGKMSTSAAVACVLSEALPFLEMTRKTEYTGVGDDAET